MTNKAALSSLLWALCIALGSHATEISTSIPPPEPKGLNMTASGILVAEGTRAPIGFLIGGGYEFPTPIGIDLNLGMSFQRFGAEEAQVTMINAIDVTAARHAPHSVFFGFGVGSMFAAGVARPAGKLFAGVELFHQQPVPIQVALELMMKSCGQDVTCPQGERQVWLAGRLGFRL